jgi:hypothetical protein
MNVRQRIRATAVVGMLLITLVVPAVVAAQAEEELDAARDATEAFRDVAVAEDAGYGLPAEGPLHECIANLDGPGAMGLHYINGDLVGDTELDPTTPEALVYAPTSDGGLELVALEYVVFAEAWDETNDEPPMLFDQVFMLTEEPNRYELPAFYALHVWIWKENPDGTFANFNPEVSCEPTVPDTAVGAGHIDPPLAVVGVGLLAIATGVGMHVVRRRTW